MDPMHTIDAVDAYRRDSPTAGRGVELGCADAAAVVDTRSCGAEAEMEAADAGATWEGRRLRHRAKARAGGSDWLALLLRRGSCMLQLHVCSVCGCGHFHGQCEHDVRLCACGVPVRPRH